MKSMCYDPKTPKDEAPADTIANTIANIEKAWAMIYLEDNDRLKYFVISKEKAFKVKHIIHNATYKSELPKNIDYNLQLFTVNKTFLVKQETYVITVGPTLPTGIIVDGKLCKKPRGVRGGSCRISIPGHDLHFIFDAFYDISSHPNLKHISKEYKLITALGKGGFGKVYKALSIYSDTQDFCAIKIELVSDAISMQTEFELVAQMKHPGIIKFFDFITRGGNKYLITEFARGGTLHERLLENERIPEEPGRHIMKQIFSAVSYLHNVKDVVHRDIKPENIVCMTSNVYCVAKLIDFGLACQANSIEMSRVAGQNKFMPPEMLNRYVHYQTALNTKFTKAVDVWSLGITLFLVLTGDLPFSFTGNIEMFLQTVISNDMNTETPHYESLGDDAKRLIHDCLKIKDTQRPAIEQVLNNKWFATT